ncbi:MAG TPA: N-formylglutamate amidohydrolase [Polyangiales bacterium]|nr:N-formylglutamate amidohydrolase [Polyangiales bacterium]
MRRAVLNHDRVEPFKLSSPNTSPVPLLVEVPHAGTHVPEPVLEELVVPADALLRDADIYVDELFANAPQHGAALLCANVSRFVVDLNRAQDDFDSATVSDHPTAPFAQPRGVVWRATTDGRPLLRRPLTFSALRKRLDSYYVPYHAALSQTLEALRTQFGFALLVAGHSMPSRGRSLHMDAGIRRADVVPGTRGRTTADARVIDLVDAHFRGAGLSVRHDDPYKGGFSTTHYGRPDLRVHAIQIELNRALYVDETTFQRRHGDFEKLQGVLDSLFGKLGALDLR